MEKKLTDLREILREKKIPLTTIQKDVGVGWRMVYLVLRGERTDHHGIREKAIRAIKDHDRKEAALEKKLQTI